MSKTVLLRPALPTKVGQRVLFVGYGGAVTMSMVGHVGLVLRFTRHGNPVISVSLPNDVRRVVEVTDRYGCAKLVDNDNKIVWEDA